MKPILKKYSYDDVLIVPKYSTIIPRDVKLNTSLTEQIKLRIPVISSPMDTVTESAMAIEIAQLGGAGFIHKNMPLDEQILNIKRVKKVKPLPGATLGVNKKLFVGISISHSISDININKLIDAGADALVLDSAHGHSKNIINKVKRIKNKYPNLQLIAGNVATTEAARDLALAGADALRVGIGPGAICTTRIVTGIGVPQLSAIMDAKAGVEGTNTKIIADGGIKSSGDMVKALAAGADAVMIGSMAAGTQETPGEKI
jgi:IMP dehydrogenase